MTKADKIRSTTDDEELLFEIGYSCYRCTYNDKDECSVCTGTCRDGNLKWLKQDAKEVNEE